jgi:hypothetical protein
MEQGIPLMTSQEIKQMRDETSLAFTGSYHHFWQRGWTGDAFRFLFRDTPYHPQT